MFHTQSSSKPSSVTINAPSNSCSGKYVSFIEKLPILSLLKCTKIGKFYSFLVTNFCLFVYSARTSMGYPLGLQGVQSLQTTIKFLCVSKTVEGGLGACPPRKFQN